MPKTPQPRSRRPLSPAAPLFAENLTKEQYSAAAKQPKTGLLSVSRDALNPMLNTETLRNRLAVIQHYKFQHGAEFAYWPHFFMRNVATHLMKYKFNYAVKGFAAYLVYRSVADYRHHNQRMFLNLDQHGQFFLSIGASTALFGGICALM